MGRIVAWDESSLGTNCRATKNSCVYFPILGVKRGNLAKLAMQTDKLTFSEKLCNQPMKFLREKSKVELKNRSDLQSNWLVGRTRTMKKKHFSFFKHHRTGNLDIYFLFISTFCWRKLRFEHCQTLLIQTGLSVVQFRAHLLS